MSEAPPRKRARTSSAVETAQQPPTLGAPRFRPPSAAFATKGNVQVTRTVTTIADLRNSVESLVDALDSRRGCLFQSSYEYPGRYARWTMGFVDPPLALETWGRRFRLTALNGRGEVLLEALAACVAAVDAVATVVRERTFIEGTVVDGSAAAAAQDGAGENGEGGGGGGGGG